MTAMAAVSVASSCGEQSSLRHTRRSRRGHLIDVSPVKESVRQQCHMVKALLASRHGVGGGGARTTSTRKREEDGRDHFVKVCVCGEAAGREAISDGGRSGVGGGGKRKHGLGFGGYWRGHLLCLLSSVA